MLPYKSCSFVCIDFFLHSHFVQRVKWVKSVFTSFACLSRENQSKRENHGFSSVGNINFKTSCTLHVHQCNFAGRKKTRIANHGFLARLNRIHTQRSHFSLLLSPSRLHGFFFILMVLLFVLRLVYLPFFFVWFPCNKECFTTTRNHSRWYVSLE